MIKTFKDRYGFARADVTLANWRTAPYNRWTFQNVRDFVPTAVIAAEVPAEEVPLASEAFLNAAMETGLAGTATARAFLDVAHTDAFVLMRRKEHRKCQALHEFHYGPGERRANFGFREIRQRHQGLGELPSGRNEDRS